MGHQYISRLVVCFFMATLIQKSLQGGGVPLGAVCAESGNTDTCADTYSTCVDTEPCACDVGYYDDNGDEAAGTCKEKPALGVACSDIILCADAHAKTCDATVTTCTCADDYPQNSATPPVCVASTKPALGEACSATNPCADENTAPCDETVTTCTCAVGYTKNIATPPVCVKNNVGTLKSSLAMLPATIALLLRGFLNL